KLTRDNVPWQWTEREQGEFEDVKDALADTLLVHPDFSAALCQLDEKGIERPVQFASRALSSAEVDTPFNQAMSDAPAALSVDLQYQLLWMAHLIHYIVQH
ncbi:hypothetical protein FOZ63_019343, partial [Perkinsus olseni]